MLKKISIILSVVAALGLSLAVLSPSYAKPQQNKNQNQNVQVKKNIQVNKNVHMNKNVQFKKNYVVGRKYNGHVWYGRNRHRWHGDWYEYGVGPCWINVDGAWFWNVLACP